jgi:hypothetical protein
VSPKPLGGEAKAQFQALLEVDETLVVKAIEAHSITPADVGEEYVSERTLNAMIGAYERHKMKYAPYLLTAITQGREANLFRLDGGLVARLVHANPRAVMDLNWDHINSTLRVHVMVRYPEMAAVIYAPDGRPVSDNEALAAVRREPRLLTIDKLRGQIPELFLQQLLERDPRAVMATALFDPALIASLPLLLDTFHANKEAIKEVMPFVAVLLDTTDLEALLDQYPSAVEHLPEAICLSQAFLRQLIRKSPGVIVKLPPVRQTLPLCQLAYEVEPAVLGLMPEPIRHYLETYDDCPVGRIGQGSAIG